MCQSVFKVTISRIQVIIAGFCIAGNLAAAVLAGVVRNITVKSARKELTVRIATKNFAGYFLPHEGYNFKLKTSSIP